MREMNDHRTRFDVRPALGALTALMLMACSPSGAGAKGGATGGATGGTTGGSSGEGSRPGTGGEGGRGEAGSRGTPAGSGGSPGNGGSPGDGGAPGGAGGGPGTTGALRIYWIDTEGGAATVLAAPTGEVVVVDAGFPGSRDSARVADVLQNDLHATRIDAMIVTHYHTDHVGGVPTLAGLLPISRYFDHGAPVEAGSGIDAYLATFATAEGAAKRTIVRPGDKLAFGMLELTFVTSAGEVVDPPLPTAVTNIECAEAISKSNIAGAENPMSVGFVARFGTFDFVDLGDLTWNVEQKLMCPTNRIGVVDLYQVSHHGMDISSSPQLVRSLAPLVAVMNNGATKGGSAATFEVLDTSPGLQALWSLHHVTANDDARGADREPRRHGPRLRPRGRDRAERHVHAHERPHPPLANLPVTLIEDRGRPGGPEAALQPPYDQTIRWIPCRPRKPTSMIPNAVIIVVGRAAAAVPSGGAAEARLSFAWKAERERRSLSPHRGDLEIAAQGAGRVPQGAPDE